VCESGEGVRHLWFAMIRRQRPLAPRICSTLPAHGWASASSPPASFKRVADSFVEIPMNLAAWAASPCL